MNAPRDLAPRLIHVLEAAEAGDTGLVIDIARDLVDELQLERGQARCRWCSLTDWPGLVEKHERVVHADELIDLEEQRRGA